MSKERSLLGITSTIQSHDCLVVQDIFDVSSSLYLVANPVALYPRGQEGKEKIDPYSLKRGPMESVFLH